MSDRKPPDPVKAGNVTISFYAHRDGWRGSYKDPSGTWRYVTRKLKKDVVEAAKKKALELQQGTRDLSNLTEGEKSILRRVRTLGITHSDLDEWDKAKNLSSPTVAEAILQMVEQKTAARGVAGVHLQMIERDLKTLPQDAQIGTVGMDAIVKWLDSYRARGTGQRRLRNLRATAVTLFRWAQGRGWLPEGKTAPERTEAITEGRGRGAARAVVEIYTPSEFRGVFATVPDNWRPFMVLAAFAGLRTEEIMPAYRTQKDGLDWRNVDRAHGVIRVPAVVSKTGHGRIIPIQPNLEAWLTHLDVPAAGPIIAGSPSNADNERRAVAKGWKKNGLRHSFGSYRTAQTQNMPQVALEMGNSVGMIRKHYYEAVTQARGEEWFQIAPPEILH